MTTSKTNVNITKKFIEKLLAIKNDSFYSNRTNLEGSLISLRDKSLKIARFSPKKTSQKIHQSTSLSFNAQNWRVANFNKQLHPTRH